MNKLHLIGFLVLYFFSISCKSQKHYNQKNVIIPLIESFIEYRNEKKVLDKKRNILLIGANDDVNKNLSISFYFINPELLLNFKYSKVYEINGYKVLIDDSLNKADFLKYIFKDKEVEYENFNLAKFPISYNTNYWNIILNSNNEILEIFPKDKSHVIKDILIKKRLKLSRDYVD